MISGLQTWKVSDGLRLLLWWFMLIQTWLVCSCHTSYNYVTYVPLIAFKRRQQSFVSVFSVSGFKHRRLNAFHYFPTESRTSATRPAYETWDQAVKLGDLVLKWNQTQQPHRPFFCRLCFHAVQRRRQHKYISKKTPTGETADQSCDLNVRYVGIYSAKTFLYPI